MHGLDAIEGDGGDTVFRDVILLALAGFVAIVIILLPHLNPPVQALETQPPPGNVVVEIRWPDAIDADVDLWVAAPGDVPVGYSNLGGTVFNLLRDDLGHRDDLSRINYEVAYSRGRPAGEYTVNLHLYADSSGQLPLAVTVVASLKKDAQSRAVPVARKEVALRHVGEEATAFRFRLSDDGELVPGSLHDLPRPLRSAQP